jgi:hypothetical protein
MVKPSLTITRQSATILRMEYQLAQELGSILRQARNELAQALEANPGNWGLLQYQKVLKSHVETLDRRLSQAGSFDRTLETGRNFGHELTGEAGTIPRNSKFWEPLPTLPLEAIAIERSKFADLIHGLTDAHRTLALREVRLSLALGEGTQKTIDRLLGTGLSGLQGRDGIFRTARTRAETIARTVSNDLINRGALLGYQKLNQYFPELEMQKMWITTSDNRTSDRCASLVGQIRDLGENFQAFDGWTGLNPPSHPNCRSRIVSVTNRYKAEWEAKWETSRPANSPTS